MYKSIKLFIHSFLKIVNHQLNPINGIVRKTRKVADLFFFIAKFTQSKPKALTPNLPSQLQLKHHTDCGCNQNKVLDLSYFSNFLPNPTVSPEKCCLASEFPVNPFPQNDTF